MIWVGFVCGQRRVLLGEGGSPWKLGESSFCLCCNRPECRAVVCGDDAGQQEDLDALPVEEQAAIMCSAEAADNAADVMRSVVETFSRDAVRVMDVVMARVGDMFAAELELNDDLCLSFAEAEARIRTGEVRP